MTTAWSGGLTYSPTTSRTFSSNLGSRETLNVLTLCGFRPCCSRILNTVETAIPSFAASARSVQWLACSGGGDIASAVSSLTLSPETGLRPRLRGMS